MAKLRDVLLFVLVVLSLSVAPMLAQSSNQGSLVGTVYDTTGGAIPGVQITVTNVATQTQRSGITGDTGNYRIDFLIPANYSLKAELTGFKTAELKGINLQVGDVMRVDVKLEVGEVSDIVTVSGVGTRLNTETNAQGHVIDSNTLQNLPLNGRDFLSLAGLVPGAVSETRYGVAFSGVRGSANAFTIDGADSTDMLYNTLVSRPALDAIQEFRVETSGFSAQQGRSAGGVVQVVTKSGSNGLHGTAYWYHRNKALDALPFFYNGQRKDVGMYLYHQYGGSIGGPVVIPKLYDGRNKTFFFTSVEGFKQLSPGTFKNSFAPTAKERVGDLSETPNPWTGTGPGTIKVSNPWNGEFIQGQQIPAEWMTPLGKKIMSLLPEPNYNDPFWNLRLFLKSDQQQPRWLTRIDHNFSESDALYGTFNFNNINSITQAETRYGDLTQANQDRTLGLTYTHSFSPNLVNDLKFSRTWNLNYRHPTLDDKNYGVEWGMSETLHRANYAPRMFLWKGGQYSYFTLGTDGDYGHENFTNYFKNDLAWIKNNHTFYFGADFRRQDYNWKYLAGGSNPALGYNDGNDAGVNLARYRYTGNLWGDVLTGIPSYINIYKGTSDWIPTRRNAVGLWVQDNWKVTPRLTLNLGLRYDYEQPFTSANGNIMTINWEQGKVQFGKGADPEILSHVKYPFLTDGPLAPFEASKKNFAPRIGFAFRPFNDSKTVIRAGYGIFWDSLLAFTTTYMTWTGPFGGEATYWGYNAKPVSSPDKQYHVRGLDQELYNIDAFVQAKPGSMLYVSPYYPNAYVQQWNLTLGHDLGEKFTAELAYAGSKGTNLSGYTNIRTIMPLDKVIPFQTTYGAFGQVWSKGANSKYHALQTSLRKDTSQGLNFLATYTWSKAIAQSSQDNVLDNTLVDTTVNGGLFISRPYGLADFDVRHRFTLAGTWELPFGQGKPLGSGWNRWVDGVLGGWQSSYLFELQGGFPVSIFAPSGYLPDRVCDGNLPKDQRSQAKWYDYTCFVTHPVTVIKDPVTGANVNAMQHGNAGRNIITGPGVTRTDMGIQKYFRVREDYKLQFRAEFFNAFNHINPTRPANNRMFNNESGAKIVGASIPARQIQVALRFMF